MKACTIYLSLLLFVCFDVSGQQKKIYVRNDELSVCETGLPVGIHDISTESISLPSYYYFFADKVFKSKKYHFKSFPKTSNGKYEQSYKFDSIGRLIHYYKIINVGNEDSTLFPTCLESIGSIKYETATDKTFVEYCLTNNDRSTTNETKWQIQYNKHKLIDTVIEQRVDSHYETKVLPTVKYYCVYDSVPRLLYAIRNTEGRIDTIEDRRYFVGDITSIRKFLARTYKVKLRKCEEPIVVENRVTKNQYCYIKTRNKIIYLDNYRYLCISGVKIKYNTNRHILSYSLLDYKMQCDSYEPCTKQCSQSDVTHIGNYFKTDIIWSSKNIKTDIKLYSDWIFDTNDVLEYYGLSYLY